MAENFPIIMKCQLSKLWSTATSVRINTKKKPNMEIIVLLLKTVLPILFMMPVDLLFTLFAEPEIDKVKAGKLRKTRGIIETEARSLPAGIAAIAAGMLYSLLSWLTKGHSLDTAVIIPLSRCGAHICRQHKSSPWPSDQLVTCKCNAISDLSCGTVITYKTWGERVWSCHLS